MLYKSFVFSALFVSFGCLSQSSQFDVNANTGFLFSANTSASNKERVDGSPYIDDKFYPSQISGVTSSTPPMRYNAYKDELEFVHAGKTYYVTKMDGLKARLSNKSYKFVTYSYEKGSSDGYLVVLVNNANEKYSLYKKEKVILIPLYDSGSGYREAVPAHYKAENDKYFLGDADVIVTMPKKKELLKMYPNQTAALENYIKEKKVSFSNEADLIELVKFMNTLK